MPIPAIAMAALPLLGRLFSGGAQGQAGERGGQNQFNQNQDSQRLNLYGTQQNALLSSLLAQDRGAMDRYGTQQAATTNALQGRQSATTNALNSQSAEGLNRAQLGLQAPGIRASQSVMGSLMKNLQPMQMSTPAGQRGHETTITGGLSASALDPTTRQHGDELMKAALMAQLSGSDVPKATDFMSGVQDWGSSVLAPPPATDYGKAILPAPALSGYEKPGRGESLLSGGGMIANILGEILRLRNQGGFRGVGDDEMSGG